MILCDSEIKAALQHSQILVTPPPLPEQFSTSALDLRLGETEFKRWKLPGGPGINLSIDPSQPGFYHNILQFLEDVPRESDQSVIIKPNGFILALTHERIELPEVSRIAARVEGKSSLARIGLGVHITAPTIHAGFKGNLVLEIKNYGDLPVRLRPLIPICQLIFEMVLGTPSRMMTGIFQGQASLDWRSEEINTQVPLAKLGSNAQLFCGQYATHFDSRGASSESQATDANKHTKPSRKKGLPQQHNGKKSRVNQARDDRSRPTREDD